MIVGSAKVTVLISVERRDSKWIPFEHRMIWCKQRSYNIVDWAQEEVYLPHVRSPLPGTQKLRVGERATYKVTMNMVSTRDYCGEYDSYVEILKCARYR